MIQPLTNPDVLKSVLASNKIRASKALGQNFLICEEVIQSVLIALEGGPKNITELGPGLGTLTQGLISNGYTVRAIEKDDEFVKILPGMMPAKLRMNLTIIHGDLEEEKWPASAEATAANNGYAIVGNIPYNLSGFIIRRLTKMLTPPQSAIFLMQKEVADRILMTDGMMSLPSLSIALWGSAELLLRVPPGCFIPQPNVHSSLIMMRPSADQLPVEEREEILAKAKPFFQAKRKQIGSVLKKEYSKNPDEVAIIENTTGIATERRPETLSAEDWVRFAKAL